MLGTILSVVSTILLVVVIVLLASFKRSIPDVQEVLDDVGASISEQLGVMFEKPTVKAAMSQLGKKSGEVRASTALRNKVATQAMNQFPGLKLILDQFDITPVEGLQLMQDPLIGPLIQGALGRATGALQKAAGGFNSPSGSSSGSVPEMK